MKKETCAICATELTDQFCCAACDAAEAIIQAGGCHPHYHELLSEQIGNLLMSRDWHTTIDVKKMFPRFA